MAKRSYGQLCAVSRALDLLGERWTLLIVRELLFGPRRFGELLEALPGIGPNLLSARMKALRDAGVAQRLAMRGGGVGYELTDAGRALDDVLQDLARWQLRWAARPPAGVLGDASARWAILALRARFEMVAGGGSRTDAEEEAYQVEVEDEAFVLRVAGGVLEAGAGRDPTAAVVLNTDPVTLARIALGAVSLEGAAAAGAVQARGSPFAVARMARRFALEGGERT